MSKQTTPTDGPEPMPELSPELRKRIAREEQIRSLAEPLKVRRIAWITVAFAVSAPALVSAWLWNAGKLKEHWWLVLAAPIVVVIYVLLCVGYLTLIRAMVRWQLQRGLATRITAKSEELQERLEEDFFNNLVKINFKYIDKYYLQTQLQADKSFLLCAAAASVSLLVVIGGIVILYFKPDVKEAGYVATASGTLGEFIAAVFFYLYNRTITKMGEYHQKLVLTQNISLALKISEELPPAEQVMARTKLIDYLSKDINLFLTAKSGEASSLRKGRKGGRRKKMARTEEGDC